MAQSTQSSRYNNAERTFRVGKSPPGMRHSLAEEYGLLVAEPVVSAVEKCEASGTSKQSPGLRSLHCLNIFSRKARCLRAVTCRLPRKHSECGLARKYSAESPETLRKVSDHG